MALRKLLGVDNLLANVAKKEEVAVSKLEGKPTLLYFGAHWCPPCRQFSPILAKLYKKLKSEKKEFEIVYVSADNTQEEFDENFKDHPWVALPFTHRKQKTKLSRKFKVSTIPTLIILDKDGRMVSNKGRQSVMQDQEGKDFPWIPKSVWEILKDAELVYNDGRKIQAAALKEHDAVGIYFSGHWGPPCRAFTPRLASVYRKLKAKSVKMEIIFASLDQSEEEFSEYFSEMPWPAIKMGDKRIQELIESFGVESLPTLVTVKQDGTVINKAAREVADDDEAAEQFPWAPASLPPVCALNPSSAVVHALNNDICAILSINGAPNRTTAIQEFHKAVNGVTTDINAKVESEAHVRCLLVDDEDAAQVGLYRNVLRAVGAGVPKHGEATVLIFNLPAKKTRFVSGELSESNILAAIKAFHQAAQEEDN